MRKKRKTTASVSTPPEQQSAEQFNLPQQSMDDIPSDGIFPHNAPTTFETPVTQLEDPGTGGSSTYIGRSHYEGQHVIDETSARSYTAHRQNALCDPELRTLEVWKAFDLPPRPVHHSLVEAFMEHCYPWMPMLDDTEKQRCSTQDASLLLLQSIFLAASRVVPPTGLLNSATPADFYQRARALYWVSHEKNPLTVIKAITMLHWYNPDGPAFVSYDTSEYWLKIGAGLAFQIGLHKRPNPGMSGAIRRRVWWSLVVRIIARSKRRFQ